MNWQNAISPTPPTYEEALALMRRYCVARLERLDFEDLKANLFHEQTESETGRLQRTIGLLAERADTSAISRHQKSVDSATFREMKDALYEHA